MPADTLIAAVPGQTGIYLNIPIARFMLPGSTTMFGEFHYEQHPCRKHNPPPLKHGPLKRKSAIEQKEGHTCVCNFGISGFACCLHRQFCSMAARNVRWLRKMLPIWRTRCTGWNNATQCKEPAAEWSEANVFKSTPRAWGKWKMRTNFWPS